MGPPATLTLAQATQMLQTALQNQERLSEVASDLASSVSRAGELARLDLPPEAVRSLEDLREGRGGGGHEVLRSLALVAARVGASELERARAEDASSRHERGAREAIRELLSSRLVTNRVPNEAFLAKVARPEDGFAPFKTENGTQIAFHERPSSLGEPWSEIVQGLWNNGIGLVLFGNDQADAYGMIFLHGAGRVRWSKIRSGAWQSSGGTMAFAHRGTSFSNALTRVVDKGVAMTLKWRAIDHSLQVAKHKILTGLGGSKGIVLHGRGDEAKARAMDVYAEVIRQLGITLTGSDEGVSPDWANYLAQQAPKNIVGNQHSTYRGREPTVLTAEGVFSSIEAARDEIFGGIRTTILLQGVGGIGSHLSTMARKEKYLVSGIIDIDVERLLAARQGHPRADLFLDTSVGGGSFWQKVQGRIHGLHPHRGLSSIIAACSEARIFSPNAGPHPITFDVATALIHGGYRAVVGAANNQNAYDLSGSPESIAWILQAAGIFHPADFVVNRMGAMAVVADAIQLSFHQPLEMVRQVGDSVRAEAMHAFQKGIPPYIFKHRLYSQAWNDLLTSGHATGGRFDTPR